MFCLVLFLQLRWAMRTRICYLVSGKLKPTGIKNPLPYQLPVHLLFNTGVFPLYVTRTKAPHRLACGESAAREILYRILCDG